MWYVKKKKLKLWIILKHCVFLQVEDEEDIGFAEGATESKFTEYVACSVTRRKHTLVTFILKILKKLNLFHLLLFRAQCLKQELLERRRL